MNNKRYITTAETKYSDINGLNSETAISLNWIYIILGQADLVEIIIT